MVVFFLLLVVCVGLLFVLFCFCRGRNVLFLLFVINVDFVIPEPGGITAKRNLLRRTEAKASPRHLNNCHSWKCNTYKLVIFIFFFSRREAGDVWCLSLVWNLRTHLIPLSYLLSCFFCLVFLLFLSCQFSANGPFSWFLLFFYRKLKYFSLKAFLVLCVRSSWIQLWMQQESALSFYPLQTRVPDRLVPLQLVSGWKVMCGCISWLEWGKIQDPKTTSP